MIMDGDVGGKPDFSEAIIRKAVPGVGKAVAEAVDGKCLCMGWCSGVKGIVNPLLEHKVVISGMNYTPENSSL